MKKFFVFLVVLIFFFCTNQVGAVQVTLAWDANTEPELAGYKLYYGTESGQYSYFYDAGTATTFTVSNLGGGTRYFFAATAYSTEGLESDFSNEVTYDAPGTCTYSISPSSRTIASSGGTGTITVTTQSSCSWTAVGTSWVTITSGSSGTGSGTVGYSVSANPGTTARTAATSIANRIFTVNQTGVNTYTITASAGANGSISPTGVTTVNSGSSKAYTITPATGYKINTVTVNGVSVGAPGAYTFSNVTANHAIAASFSLKPVPLYRFYRYATGTHNWGLSSSRDPALYRHEGVAFYVYTQQVPGTVPVYMFLKFNGGEFYTTSVAEKTSLMGSTAFTYAGIPFYVGGPVPVYRFYNKVVNVNFFTASVSEKNSLAANTLQFAYDGVGFGTPSPP